MMIMPAPRKYPPELRERSMRLVAGPEGRTGAVAERAVTRIGQRGGVTPATRGWSKQAAIDAGERPGTTTSDAQHIKALEAQVRELKRTK
jgi:transposase